MCGSVHVSAVPRRLEESFGVPRVGVTGCCGQSISAAGARIRTRGLCTSSTCSYHLNHASRCHSGRFIEGREESDLSLWCLRPMELVAGEPCAHFLDMEDTFLLIFHHVFPPQVDLVMVFHHSNDDPN